MKKSKENLNRIHKEKCRELKRIRGRIAEDLGIELRQRECTYEGYCSGTCPACRKEEMQLNAALLKRQLQGANLKGRAAATGLAAAAALCLAGCTPPEQNEIDGMLESLSALPRDGSLPAGEQTEGEFLQEEDTWKDGPATGQTEGEFLLEKGTGEDGPTAGQTEGEFLPEEGTEKDGQTDAGAWSIEQLEGEIPAGFLENPEQSEYETPGEYVELEGDVAYPPESSAAAEDLSIPDTEESTQNE